MKIVIDTDTGKLMVAGPRGVAELALFSPAGYDALTHVRGMIERQLPIGETFLWAGHPVQEHPETLFRLQETIARIQPQLLVHVGRTELGSLLYCAGVMRQFGGERVLAVDADVPADDALTQAKITPVAGVAAAADAIRPQAESGGKMLVILGSTSDKSALRIMLEEFAQVLPVGSALISLEILSFGEDQAQHAAEAFTEFALEHPEYHAEFMSGRTNTSFVPFLCRVK